MDITVVIHTFTDKKSGKEIFNWKFVKYMAQKGHKLQVVSANFKKLQHPNITFHPVSMYGKSLGIHRLWFSLAAYRKICQLETDLVFTNGKSLFGDVVRVGGVYASHLQRKIRRKTPGLPRQLYSLSKKVSISSRLSKYLESKTFGNNSLRKIIVNTDGLREEILEHYSEVDPSQIDVIYNGVDLEEFDWAKRERLRNRRREKLGLDSERPTALFVGNEFHRKGLDYFLQMLQTKENWIGLIVGDDSPPSLDASLSDRVQFLGRVDDMASYYAAADVLVLPSRYDGFAMVTLEALAMGTYISLSENCGAREIINDREIGHIFSLNESPIPDRLSDKIFDQELRKKRAEFARKYSWTNQFNEYEKVLERVK